MLSIKKADNGITVEDVRLTGKTMVFTNDQVEEALEHIYRLCFNWNVGDFIVIDNNAQGDEA